jgi:hypothetical protein
MRAGAIATAAAAAGILWVGLSAQQEMLPKPGPGSGITKVVGAVDISNTPDVRVMQMPPISISNPPFVRKGARYVLTWSDGGTEEVLVAEIGQDGWVQVESRRTRWVNLRLARSVEAGR